MRRVRRLPQSLLLLLLTVSALAQEPLSSKALTARATDASVLILAGMGAGRLEKVGTGALVSADGDILTALHVVKGAAEVQVRLANGDVFDRVQLTGTDERRDIAALKIAAHVRTFLTPAQDDPAVSDPVYAVTNANGLGWSATSGIVAVANAKPDELIRNAKTIYLQSKTQFLTIDTLQRALLANKEWPELGLVIVGSPDLADLVVRGDRPLFTYVHTFVLTDRKTTIVLGSGKQTAFDGTIASGGLSKDLVKILATVRLPHQGKSK